MQLSVPLIVLCPDTDDELNIRKVGAGPQRFVPLCVKSNQDKGYGHLSLLFVISSRLR